MQLTLIVENTRDLSGGAKVSFVFDEQGGVIGSNASADWQLVDSTQSVAPNHLAIRLENGHFCAKVVARSGVYLNDAHGATPIGETFRIMDGDKLKIGIFTVSAYLLMDSQSLGGEQLGRRFVSIGALVGDNPEEDLSSNSLFDSSLMKRPGTNVALAERLAASGRTDPALLLEEDRDSRATSLKDPILALERDNQSESKNMTTRVEDYLESALEGQRQLEAPDDRQPGSSHFSLPVAASGSRHPSNPEQRGMPSESIDAYLETLALSSRNHGGVRRDELSAVAVRDNWLGSVGQDENSDEPLVDHVVLRPLCQALGLAIQKMTVPQANQLAHDIGAAMLAAIEGIMSINKGNVSDKSHMAETHLHAIEDNPLRLEQSAENVIHDLFLVQSPVHLSASAAIEESLTFIRHHQEASRIASDKALESILAALSPHSLGKRFKKYKGHAPRTGDLDAWHWNMYQHYYAEMRSSQQGGLSRLFWEIYGQVYDREMRRLTTEE